MGQYTLADARRILEDDLAPGLNEFWLRTYRDALAQAEQRARTRAAKYVGDRAAEVEATRDEALKELTSCRDGLDDLAREGKTGRLPASEYNQRLRDLRRRQQAADDQLSEADAIVERIEDIETDPIAWADDIARRLPKLLEEFPF
jgi:uncharacterized coiled-coil DUF342 family protein